MFKQALALLVLTLSCHANGALLSSNASIHWDTYNISTTGDLVVEFFLPVSISMIVGTGNSKDFTEGWGDTSAQYSDSIFDGLALTNQSLVHSL